MNVIQTLSFRQLFNLKAKTLEQRITNFYHKTQNSSVTIKYILALKVRCQLGAAEFDHFLKDLVREVFMHTKATRTMKRLYFMAPEWRTLKLRVFPVKKFGEKLVSVARSLISFVRPEETSEP